MEKLELCDVKIMEILSAYLPALGGAHLLFQGSATLSFRGWHVQWKAGWLLVVAIYKISSLVNHTLHKYV